MAAVAIAPQFYRHRPVLVAANLADLHGPVTGKLTLPLWVFWSFGGEPYAWNLDDPVGRREMYRTVVREAKRPADLDVLHGPTLVRIWRDTVSAHDAVNGAKRLGGPGIQPWLPSGNRSPAKHAPPAARSDAGGPSIDGGGCSRHAVHAQCQDRSAGVA